MRLHAGSHVLAGSSRSDAPNPPIGWRSRVAPPRTDDPTERAAEPAFDSIRARAGAVRWPRPATPWSRRWSFMLPARRRRRCAVRGRLRHRRPRRRLDQTARARRPGNRPAGPRSGCARTSIARAARSPNPLSTRAGIPTGTGLHTPAVGHPGPVSSVSPTGATASSGARSRSAGARPATRSIGRSPGDCGAADALFEVDYVTELRQPSRGGNYSGRSRPAASGAAPGSHGGHARECRTR